MADPRERFGRFSEAYATSEGHARGEELGRLLEIARPQASWRVLDVATGAGHTALLFAPHVAHVVALDITPQMLETTRSLASERGVTNLTVRLAPAEALPFGPASFDLVTCRIAPHHFESCPEFLGEAARVLKSGGRLLVQDHLLPEDEELGRQMDHFERTRDPSHRRAYSRTEWERMIREAGLKPDHAETASKTHEFRSWTERQGNPPEVVAELQEQINRASAAMKAWMRPQDWGTPKARFTTLQLIIGAHKP